MRPVRRLSTTLLTLPLICTGCGGKPSRQLHEKAGGFSYDPPPGWTVAELPGLKYRIARGPVADAFAPNINVVDETFQGTLDAYVEANVGNMEKLLPGLKILDRAAFQTADGEPGTRVIADTQQLGRRLRQTFYFFGRSQRRYVVTCTALADGGEALDSVFEASVKTFRMH